MESGGLVWGGWQGAWLPTAMCTPREEGIGPPRLVHGAGVDAGCPPQAQGYPPCCPPTRWAAKEPRGKAAGRGPRVCKLHHPQPHHMFHSGCVTYRGERGIDVIYIILGSKKLQCLKGVVLRKTLGSTALPRRWNPRTAAVSDHWYESVTVPAGCLGGEPSSVWPEGQGPGRQQLYLAAFMQKSFDAPGSQEPSPRKTEAHFS